MLFRTANDQTLIYNKSVNIVLADVFENFVETCIKEHRNNPFYFV